jgi:hypothetical protein
MGYGASKQKSHLLKWRVDNPMWRTVVVVMLSV